VRRLACLIACLASVAVPLHGQTMSSLYDVKAAYLYNFLRYVEWPNRPKTGALVVCVVGLEHVGAILKETIGKEKIDGREIQSKVILSPEPECHIVFAPAGTNSGIYAAYARAGRGQLTVGESEKFIEQGGVINFKEVDGKLRFEIDTEAAMRADVRISSRLLRLRLPPGEGAR
jgi:hypothetical protein